MTQQDRAQSSNDVVQVDAAPRCLRRFAAGSRHRIELRTPGAALPVLLLQGGQAGPVLVVTAAVHGDEFEGVRCALELFDELDPEDLSGVVIFVPVAHPAAFAAGTRCSPEDGADLARTFPGDAQGAASERLAFLLANFVLLEADLYVDLHSGGLRYQMPAMVGCDCRDARSLAAAEAFGAPVLWMHDEVAPGRTVSFARSRGIPWLYTEARGGGRIDGPDLRMMKSGILSVMTHLGMAHGGPVDLGSHPSLPLRLGGAGNTDAGVASCADGFLLVHVSLLQRVEKGDVLGVLVDLWGRKLEIYTAPDRGVVALIHEFNRVRPHETVFLLAQEIT